jgi:hypothetical protein
VKASSIVVAVALGLVGATSAAAEPVRLAQTFAADVIPPYEVFTIIRSMGLNPLGRPHYRGRTYVLRAVDRRGEEVRVVVDAYAARVLSVTPVDRQAATDYDEPPYRRRYDSGPPLPGPRVIESDPRYAPPRAIPSDPRYSSPQTAPEDDEDYPGEGPDELDADEEGETGSLPPRTAPGMIGAPRTPPAISAPATRSAAVTPPKTPLPRPRPQQQANVSEPTATADAQQKPVAAPESKPKTPKSAEDKSEGSKPQIRIIEIKRPEPRI